MRTHLLDVLRIDIRVAGRALRRQPTITLAIVAILTLSIGSATTILTVARATLVQELPVRDPERLITLWSYRDPAVPLALDASQLREVARASPTLRDVAGVVHWGAQAIPLKEGDRPLVLKQGMVSANFFKLLGAQPVLGRLLVPDDDRGGAGQVAVISYSTWVKVFQRDPHVLERRLTTTQDDVAYHIVGVAPAGLDYPVGVDYWTVPRAFDLLTVVARLSPRVSPEQARSEFLARVKALDRADPAATSPTGAHVQALPRAIMGDAQPVLLAVTASALLLLLIGAVNVGALLLVRTSQRSRELTVRRALGAKHAQLVRLLFVEHAALGVAGGVGGLICAMWMLRLLVDHAPIQLPRADLVPLAGMPLGIAGSVTAFMTVVFSTLPALGISRVDLSRDLRHDGRTGRETAGRRRVRRSLVMVQVGLAVVLMTAAGLLARSVQELQRVKLGFEPVGLSIVVFSVPFHKYASTLPELWTMFATLEDRLRAVPGVSAVTPVLYEPFVGANVMQVTPRAEGQSAARGDASAPVPLEVGGAEYFRTLQTPILRGRGLQDDDRADSERVVVVSESEARRLWPGQDALGKRLRLAPFDSTEWRTVVGVAGDVRYRRVHEATPTIFLPWRQLTQFGVFAIRTHDSRANLTRDLQRAAQEVDSGLDVWTIRSMHEYLERQWAQPQTSAVLLSGFGIAAMVLAAMGLYGLMSGLVRERTRDMGIRLALGASPRRLQSDVLREAIVVVAAGAVLGAAVSLLGSRVLRSLLFGIGPTDPIALLWVVAVLIVVAVIATFVPLRWVRRLDAVHSLRSE